MRIGRFSRGDERIFTGRVVGEDDDLFVEAVSGSVLGSCTRVDAEPIPLRLLVIHPPVVPRKVFAVAKNYPAAAEGQRPVLYSKLINAVRGPGDDIKLANWADYTVAEAELAVVIGRVARGVAAADAPSHIFGFTCANDVTSYPNLNDMVRAKGADTYGPIGPWIETELDTGDLEISCTVNGRTQALGSTKSMVFRAAECVAFVSETITLDPGDVIMTGTPKGLKISAGDHVTVTVEGIGSLTNSVVRDSTMRPPARG